MKRIKIFLASSEELRQERLELADFVEHLNHTLENLDLSVQLVKWEYLDSSMGPQHKQEEYNEVLKDCEMCIVIYWTKLGLYTKTELDAAFEALKSGKNPQKLYVYFKDIEGEETIADELREFRDSFPSKYGHFENRFRNIDTLKSQFLLQFIEYQSKILRDSSLIEVKDGKLSLGGKTYVDLMNVPFIGNNEEYTTLLKDIKKTKKLLAITEPEEEDYAELAEDLQNLEERKRKMETGLWDTALEITRLSNLKCSERLQRAIDLFNKGDNKGADAILNEEEIYKDAEQNINLIKLGEEGRKGLITNIEELNLKIKTLETEGRPDYVSKIMDLRKKIAEYSREAFGEKSEEYIVAFWKLGFGYYKYSIDLNLSAKKVEEALWMALSVLGEEHAVTAEIINDLGLCLMDLSNYEKALDYINKGLELRKKIFTQNHPHIAESYSNLGYLLEKTGKYEDAIESFQNALTSLDNLSEKKDEQYLGIMLKLGLIFADLGQFQNALEITEKTLELSKENFGEQHLQTLSAYKHIGIMYGHLGDWNGALDYQQRALELSKKISGELNEYTADTYAVIGAVYSRLGNNKLALENSLKALEINQRIFGENHPENLPLFASVALSYSSLNDYDKALEYYNLRLDLAKNFYGDIHEETLEAYQDLFDFYNDLEE
ncbi:MAG: tetratricopeptide repeat protein [Muribaculaceae bacterium]|nr:tetratricopeptide repeat protein [Muribaculaceae bacterium]